MNMHTLLHNNRKRPTAIVSYIKEYGYEKSIEILETRLQYAETNPFFLEVYKILQAHKGTMLELEHASR